MFLWNCPPNPSHFPLLSVVNGVNRCICAFDSTWNPVQVYLCVWQRSTSLEVSATTHECVSDVQSSRLSPSSVCTRRKRRSRSIPTELAAPSTSPYNERPPGCTNSREAEARKKVTLHQKKNHTWVGTEAVLWERTCHSNVTCFPHMASSIAKTH